MTLTTHYKPQKPFDLQVLNSLQHRMKLPESTMQNYRNLNKGYEGERVFYNLANKELATDCIMLYDLLLESNQTEFQVDCLLIYQQTIFLIEVKHYEGDFYIKNNNWFVVSTEKEIRNPLLQLKRSEFLFRQLLQDLGCHYTLESYIVFTNQAFMLYKTPLHLPLVFPTQLHRFMKKLNTNPSKLTLQHTKLAKLLVDKHVNKSTYERLPNYNYNELQKGIICTSCSGFLSPFSKLTLKCKRCEYEESVDLSILRSVKEFNLLFPNKKITTSAILEWCSVIDSKKIIRKVLMDNLNVIRNGRYTHYTFDHLMN
ncbi:nuclease-related domain-containing protein [Virgibacillus sp. W0181]|uniref:nuclease-related domain-containing protein n=1 Tax=Virgibacillus sp. W0181 TaxID=3391581 RepID=UPI003F4725EB